MLTMTNVDAALAHLLGAQVREVLVEERLREPLRQLREAATPRRLDVAPRRVGRSAAPREPRVHARPEARAQRRVLCRPLLDHRPQHLVERRLARLLRAVGPPLVLAHEGSHAV
jgi:hypothetical protein